MDLTALLVSTIIALGGVIAFLFKMMRDDWRAAQLREDALRDKYTTSLEAIQKVVESASVATSKLADSLELLIPPPEPLKLSRRAGGEG